MTAFPMQNMVTRKLENGARLDQRDRERLAELVRGWRALPPRSDIISHGDDPEFVHVILEGIACRYKILPDGRRSIMALLIPGDFCDMHVAILGRMDHGIGTLTPCRVVDIPRSEIEELLTDYPNIARAMWWATLVDEAVLREWLVNMGKRRADRQMAHLLCELYLRYASIGWNGDFSLPMTQEQLSDTLGITAVHAQRVVAGLRQDGLIGIEERQITIPDIARLMEFAEFDPDYLHLPS
ncbi:Crp/Fnr family transcriptional regulator [Paracoccus sp. MBLB3053]|uniref:Crp/Fnr family transcriptional regulator n=1 Tax=Paracoccus aurantius TaxID=3073814 RepID=A0ABU2HUX3_9RHOB|nr:Crp/Fnr family transcriptional regulator [Paracoccus sp. MBLB3053]MDS9468856.1 Crp/Fnr family transcriptional regulator [Paracoccus sp. MBLB3053]